MYKKLNTTDKVVAKFAPAAINVVFKPVPIPISSTAAIVIVVLNTCSSACALAVTDTLSKPLKYPLRTDAIVTKVIDGDNTCNDKVASGTSIAFEIAPAPTNNIMVPAKPINPKVTSAILKILCAPL